MSTKTTIATAAATIHYTLIDVLNDDSKLAEAINNPSISLSIGATSYVVGQTEDRAEKMSEQARQFALDYVANQALGFQHIQQHVLSFIDEFKEIKKRANADKQDGIITAERCKDLKVKADLTKRKFEIPLEREFKKLGFEAKFKCTGKKLLWGITLTQLKAESTGPREEVEETETDTSGGGDTSGGETTAPVERTPEQTVTAVGLLLAKLDSAHLLEVRKMLNLAIKEQKKRETADQKKAAAAAMVDAAGATA